LAGASSDYFRLIGPFLLSWLDHFLPVKSTFNWDPKYGAYIRDLTKKWQELVQDKLVTILPFSRSRCC